ncbi:MAG: DUF1573 domain-containing protein [Bacteroidales bacterium]|nr:DUF1573 domain-containing protein [Bacteroidales bacterium]
MIGKEINFVGIPISFNAKYKVVNYVNHFGCTPCRLHQTQWNLLISELDSLKQVQVVFIVESDSTKLGETSLPIYYDSLNVFCTLNHLPEDERFHCFLLDENNRVVLIGNPVQNPKIKDLYIRTICERLNIDYKAEKQSNPRIHLGNISKNETKTVQFEIKNSDKEVLEIDSVYTSCECTTAQVDKTQIQKNESAILTVTYFPDGTGDFYREIYVKIHDEIAPRIFEIDGNLTEI